MPRGPVLVLDDVVRAHGRGQSLVHALRHVSLTVEAGELVAVMGPSGSGKSTMLNIAGGLDRATRGSVRVLDNELGGLRPARLAQLRRHDIGYVFQQYNLIQSLTAGENVALPLTLDGRSPRAVAQLAAQALEDVGLGELVHRRPNELSGGEQQRVAIARAVVGRRALVLADEPTGALDSDTGEQILGLLRTKCDAGVAVLLVTHEAAYAQWADRVVHLRDGAVVTDAALTSEPLLAAEVGRWD